MSETNVTGGQMRCRVCGEIGHDHCNRERPASDHGISPAQLRDTIDAHAKQIELLGEKVEALEIRCAAISATASIAIGTVSDRLDAALKRIEQLEAQQARWRGAERYTEDEPEPCLTCAVRERSE